jgi:hypothetical protein
MNMTDKNKMTPEEQEARNRYAFCWGEGDIEIIDPGNADDDVYPDEPSFEDVVPERTA